MRLYIAGPMTGYPEFNYPAFAAAEIALAAAGHTGLLNPTKADEQPCEGEKTWEWYMRHTLRMVLDADALALLDNWQMSRGANLEVKVAKALGMPCEPIGKWLEAAS